MDREKKSQRRLQLTDDEKEEIKKKDRDRKAKQRKEKKQEKEIVNRKKNVEERDRQIERETECGRISEAKRRNNRSEAQAEFEKIQQLLIMRASREARSGKEHLLDNLQAKRGMRDFHENGRQVEFKERSFRDIDEETIWYKFWRVGLNFKNILWLKKPELAKKFEERVNEENVERQKLLQKSEENMRKGLWMINPHTEEYYWTVENPPPEGEYEQYNSKDEVERTTDEWGRPLDKERDD